MQIGIDLGASKIEYVLLDDVGNEHHRERTEVPKNYKDTLSIIKKIVIELERKLVKNYQWVYVIQGFILFKQD